MPINRNLLHESKFNAFKKFLITRGWLIELTKGTYEVIRARKSGKKPIILFQRMRTRHATIGWDMKHAFKLVHDFQLAEYKRENYD